MAIWTEEIPGGDYLRCNSQGVPEVVQGIRFRGDYCGYRLFNGALFWQPIDLSEHTDREFAYTHALAWFNDRWYGSPLFRLSLGFTIGCTYMDYGDVN